MEQNKKWNSNLITNIYVGLSALLISFFIVEVSARIFKFETIGTQEKYFDPEDRQHFKVPINEKDPKLFWRLKANSIYGNISINSKGFRGKEFSEEKIPLTLRIFTLGDSCTLGVGVGNDETYASVLENTLNSNSHSPNKFEVINAGVAGYTSLQGLRFLKTEIVKYKPDLVIVQFGFNDYVYTGGTSDKYIPNKQSLPFILDGMLGKSHFYRFVKRRLNHIVSGKTLYPPNRRVEIGDFQQNMRGIITIAQEVGAKVILLTLPIRPDVPLVINPIPIPFIENGKTYVEWLRPGFLDG